MVILSEFIQESSSSSTINYKYDVFLSFRGVDTRHGFTDHLHKALLDANISTFLDDEEIETGGDLKPELESAIKASRALIIVLSKNYANSSWCLDELALILKTSNQIVIPIFYHVEPTHVRKQESTFGLAMADHKQKMEAEPNANKRSQLAEKIDQWIQVLTKVANLKGKDVKNRRETEFIEEIVKDIYRRLHISSKTPLPQLFGMKYSIEFITSWLKDTSSHTTDILTILGIGGIGKTSLAKYVYGLHHDEFIISNFIEDIGRSCSYKYNGLLDLQKQLYGAISKTSSIQNDDASIYTSKIENALASKKVFLVLDDIDSLYQLDGLLGSKSFHRGSKIIITTKDASLTERCSLFKANVKPKHTKHLLEGLYKTSSRQLLFNHACVSNDRKAGYIEASEKLVKYCGGHPLALEILGKSLYDRDVAYWEECIEVLKKENNSPVNNILRMGFDSLPSKNDKELFKHIACFFVGTKRDVAETILEACDMKTRSGLMNLKERCLLSIKSNNELWMHQLVQEMGRFVVREESPDKPWKRSRLWCHEESYKVLKRKKGTENLLGLILDMRMVEKEKLRGSYDLRTDALGNMDNLMLLQLNYVQISGSYENFPEELRWLCMHGFPLKSIPSDLPMENLVALDMSYSKIESFGICYSKQKLIGSCLNRKRLLGSLKILNLSFCEELRTLGGFDQLPALESLIVTHCTNLLEVCESIEACVELVLIDLSYCNNLKKGITINKLKKVETLFLDGCNLGESRMEIRDMNPSEGLKANIGINTKTSSSTIVEAIPSYSKLFSFSLPNSLVTLSLKNNNLSTESFPMGLSRLYMLKELCLDENLIVSMPNFVRSIPRLEILSMKNCRKLTSVEHPPHTLRHLNLYAEGKSLLRKVVFDRDMSALDLIIPRKPLASSFEIEGLIKIQPLARVEEKVLCSLGWTNLDFLNQRHVHESEIQMYYEFGIFSTIGYQNVMPKWITHRSEGRSISFTIPSTRKNLRGLNVCSMPTSRFPFRFPPMIMITNVTRNRTWIYDHYLDVFTICDGIFFFLSHWMFGQNEMKGGDQVTIYVTERPHNRKRRATDMCGVSFVYDDEKRDEEEEEDDVLGYYKSWNHIIGRDLSPFQTTTGEYILSKRRITMYGLNANLYYRELLRKGARYKGSNHSY